VGAPQLTPSPTKDFKTIKLGQWTFQLGEQVINDAQLEDWRNIPQLADSCGESVYATRFSLEKTATKYVLDLGDVYYTAEVYINGKAVGKRIWKPFRFDITNYVQSGENVLEIRVKASDYNKKVQRGREGDATFSSIANSGRMANGLKGPVQIITE
jgi:Beta-galactosidase/beta-glucuronidase